MQFIQARNAEFSTLISFYFFVAPKFSNANRKVDRLKIYILSSHGTQSQGDATQSARSFFFFLSLARAGWNPNEFTNLGCTLAWNLCLIHKRYVPVPAVRFSPNRKYRSATTNFQEMPSVSKHCHFPRFLHFTHRMIFFQHNVCPSYVWNIMKNIQKCI